MTSSPQTTPPAAWRTSSFSTGQNDCVEAASSDTSVLIHDSRNREAGFLTASRDA